MQNQEKFESTAERLLSRFKILLRKIWSLIVFEIGGISLFGLIIIVATITYNIKVLEGELFQKIDYKPELSRVGPLNLRGSYTLSLIAESADAIKSGSLSSNLVDGVLGTAAAPGSGQIDYVIDLGGFFEIEEVVLYWGTYGTDQNYVQEWVLEGKDDTSAGTPWTKLSSGGFPFSHRSIVDAKNMKLAQLRVHAKGNNYIGLYEVMVNGKRITD